VKPEIPTMRRSSPSAYSTSVGSSVRHTIRSGKPAAIACRFVVREKAIVTRGEAYGRSKLNNL
jgi:hypothetical protein